MDADAFNSYLAAANLALISYSTTLMVAIAQVPVAMQMLITLVQSAEKMRVQCGESVP